MCDAIILERATQWVSDVILAYDIVESRGAIGAVQGHGHPATLCVVTDASHGKTFAASQRARAPAEPSRLSPQCRLRRHAGTPRTPIRARLPLLPSGPGGVQRDDAARGVGIRVRGRRLAHQVPQLVASPTEDSPSGLWRSPGTRVGGNPSGVQIPYPPR